MNAEQQSPKVLIDARNFQKPLGDLATTVALKVEREGPKLLTTAKFVAVDIYVMIRQAQSIYDLFFFLNADERRKKDVNWRVAYSAAVLPLVRCMIDCLYNITVLLDDAETNGPQFRQSGYNQSLRALKADEERYGGDPKWDGYIAERRNTINFLMRVDGMTLEDVVNAKTWPTLSGYLRVKKNVPLTSHQQFLKTLTLGFWKEYSGMAHATFQGLLPTALFYTENDIPYQDREHFETITVETMISLNIFRVAAILLCILTEVQARFAFDGPSINKRLHQIWKALLPAQEIKELYDERYAQLMKDKGIDPD